MTPYQLHEALYTIGWTARDLGNRLRVDNETLRGWTKGTVEIPERVGHWLAYLSDIHENALLPSGWVFPVKQAGATIPPGATTFWEATMAAGAQHSLTHTERQASMQDTTMWQPVQRGPRL